MPRPLSHVHSEIIRIANELELDPRSREYSRSKFFNAGIDPLLLEEGVVEADQLFPSTDVTKHDLEHYGGWAKLKHDAAHVFGVPASKNSTASRGVELRNLYVRKLERQAATTAYFIERLEDTFIDVFSKNKIKLNSKKYVKKSGKEARRRLTLLWSDLHFGVDVQDYEVYASRFNWKIASRRIAKLCKEAVEWCDDLSRTELRIVLNGDIMQGVIHLNDANIRPMTEQIWGATSILTSALDFLRQHFGHIEVVCMPGNHDRMTYRDAGRSTCQRWDSHAHSLYLALRQTFRNDSGIKFVIPTTGIGIVDDFADGSVIAAHGDTEPTPKNVSSKIDTERLAVKLLKLQDGVNSRRVSIALFGHWHTPTIQMLPNGTWVIVNGSLIGSEPYGQNVIGEFDNIPAQVMFDSVIMEPLNRIRIVKVKDADEDDRYDRIIPTPKIIEDGQLVV